MGTTDKGYEVEIRVRDEGYGLYSLGRIKWGGDSIGVQSDVFSPRPYFSGYYRHTGSDAEPPYWQWEFVCYFQGKTANGTYKVQNSSGGLETGTWTALQPSPVLSWAGTVGFRNDGVRPNRGERWDLFAFKVKVTDPDGDRPDYVRLILRDNWTPYREMNMERVSGSAEDGWIYRCERRLPPGFYRYAYAAADEDGRASGTPTGYHEGPEVVEHPRERPDAHVRDCCLWRWLGDNTYNSTGEGQSTDSEVDPGQRTIYKVKLQNDLPEADVLVLKGPAGTDEWGVNYLSSAGERITDAVVGEGWATPLLAPGKSVVISVRVQPGVGVAAGETHQLAVRVGRAAWGPSKFQDSADAVALETVVRAED